MHSALMLLEVCVYVSIRVKIFCVNYTRPYALVRIFRMLKLMQVRRVCVYLR